MVRLGWQRGMNLHNLLILFGYPAIWAGRPPRPALAR